MLGKPASSIRVYRVNGREDLGKGLKMIRYAWMLQERKAQVK